MDNLKPYEKLAPSEDIRMLKKLAEQLKNKSYLHVNSTSTGGGVAEILHRLNDIFVGLGIKARWEVIKGNEEFFGITKNFHNGLQGKDLQISKKMWAHYYEVNRENSKNLNLSADMVFIHDPQPAALIHYRPKQGKWVWRCHIDLSHPNRKIWEDLRPNVENYDAAIFSVSKFAQTLSIPQFIAPPSIDPLSNKNRDLSKEEIQKVLEEYQIPTDLPIMMQVSRFDPFKDPLGVIQAYRMVKKYHPCRLILAGGAASDDPESSEILARVREEAEGDPHIHILDLPPFSDVHLNALQRASTIILQKSLREGFGLTVTEALWKGKPVIGGSVGGIPLQINHGITGFLVHSVEGAAFHIRQLLHNPQLTKRMGEMGKEHVRQNFLITRQAKDYLALWVSLETPKKKNIVYLH
ncbi:MAG TPA: glycosyltransferase [Nitrospiria bacterium]|jgi:trehalose synthase